MIVSIGIGIVLGVILLFIFRELLGALFVALIWIFEDEEQRIRLFLGAVILVVLIVYKIITSK